MIGVRREQALEAFRTQMPVKFDTADEDVWINAVVVEVRDDGLAESIEQVLIPAPADDATPEGNQWPRAPPLPWEVGRLHPSRNASVEDFV